MKKFVLLSIILATIAIPAHAARAKDARVGLKRAVVRMAIFDVVYMILLLYVWPRMS